MATDDQAIAFAEKKGLKQKDNVTVESKVREVNELLKQGEPGNVSADTYSNSTGYKPQYIIDAMNKVFGLGGWGFEEISNDLVDKNEEGKPTMAVAQVKVWLREIDFQPAAYGQSRVTRGDYGDARKGAQTDALKKALSYFSVGSRAYHGLLKA